MRAPCCDKSKVKKGAWSDEEDSILVSFIHSHGPPNNWRSLPSQAGLLRCGKSCRLRWINYLRPDVKRGNFTPQDEDAIIHLHHSLGNKWSKIASHFPGRTDNEIKNVWNTHLKKRLAVKDVDSSCEKSDDTKESSSITLYDLSSCSSTTFTSRGDQNMENKGNGVSMVNKMSFQKQNNAYNVLTTGRPSCSSSSVSSQASSINISSSDDMSSRPRGGEELLLGEVVDMDDDHRVVIEEVPMECDTDFWEMLDNLELELEVADRQTDININNKNNNNNTREVEFKKWMRCLENELDLGPAAPTTTTTTTSAGTLHNEEGEGLLNNINTTADPKHGDDENTAKDNDDGSLIDPRIDYFPTWPPSPHGFVI